MLCSRKLPKITRRGFCLDDHTLGVKKYPKHHLRLFIRNNLVRQKYRHIQNYCLSNSKTFQDGNGNGNFEEINSNDFLDGNWESMEIKGTAGAKTVTVMVIHPNFKTVTVTVIFGK